MRIVLDVVVVIGVLSLAKNYSLWIFSLVYPINLDDNAGICIGVGVSFCWVNGGCGGDSCWCYYITSKGGKRVAIVVVLLMFVFVVVSVVIVAVVVVVVLVVVTGCVGVAVVFVEKVVFLGLI